MYILLAELSEEERKTEIENLHKIITDLDGKVLSVDTDNWGLRDLAYPINDLTKGYYVVIEVEANNRAMSEFDRLAKLNARVLRHLVIAK